MRVSAGWVLTGNHSQSESLTEDGEELPHVCFMECESGIIVYDRLVKPPKPVINYLTR